MSYLTDHRSDTPSSEKALKGSIHWVQDQNSVILVDDENQRVTRLEGDEALIWGWLNAGLSLSRCAHLLGMMAGLSDQQALKQIEGFCENWQKQGWLMGQGDGRE
jgi:hypothetical protein